MLVALLRHLQARQQLHDHQGKQLFVAYFFLGLLVCYIPLFSTVDEEIIRDEDYRQRQMAALSLTSKQYRSAMVASVTVTGIMTIDIVLDIIFGILRDGLFINTWMLSLVFIQSLTLLFVKRILVYWSEVNFIEFAVVLSLYFFLYEYGGDLWRSNSWMSPSFCVLINASLSFFLKANSLRFDLTANGTMNQIINICEVLAVCVTLLLSSLNSIRFFFEIKKKSEWRSSDYNCVYCCVALIAVFLYRAILFIMSPTVNISTDLSVTKVTLRAYGLLVLVAFTVVFNARIKEWDLSRLARKVLETKQSFAVYVSQEIRSPLQIVLISLSVSEHRLASVYNSETSRTLRESVALESEHRDDQLLHQLSKLQEFIGEAKEASKMACRTLEAVLEDNTTEDAVWTVANVNVVIEGTLRVFAMPAKAAGVEILLKYLSMTAKEALVSIQQSKIRQIIGKMLSNALKFSPRGSNVDVVVSLRYREKKIQNVDEFSMSLVSFRKPRKVLPIVRKEENTVRITVKDQGIGLSEENQKKLFKSSNRFNSNNFQNGGSTGIGLTMCYGVMKMHGGDMGVHSAGEGQGCEFWIELPLVAVCGEANFDATIPLSSPLDVSLSVLVVDDVSSVRKTMCRMLKLQGVCEYPSTAANGEEAVRLIKRSMDQGRPYDLVLISYFLPSITGPTAASIARDIGYKELIIGVTSNGDSKDVEHFKACGANDVMLKPMDVGILKSIVKVHRMTKRKEKGVGAARITLGSRDPKRNLFASQELTWFKVASLSTLFFATIFFILLPGWNTLINFSVGANLDHLLGDGAYDAVSSEPVYAAIVVCLSISLYLTFEACLHRYFGLLVECFFMYAILLPTMIASNLIWLFIVTRGYMQVGWSVWNAEVYVMLSCQLLYQYRFSRAVWDPRVILFLFVLDSIRIVSRILSGQSGSLRDDLARPWVATNMCCFLISTVITACQLWRHIVHLRKKDHPVHSDYCGVVSSLLLFYFDIQATIKVLPVQSSNVFTFTPVMMVLYIVLYKIVDVVNVIFLSRSAVIERNRRMNTIHQKRDVIRRVSHEIRTPLNILSMGFVHLQEKIFVKIEKLITSNSLFAENFLEEFGKDKAAMAEAKQACVDCIALLNDLLVYEKLQSNQLVLEKASCAINPLLQGCFESIVTPQRIEYNATGIGGSSAAMVMVDEIQLINALQDLVKYASSIYPLDSTIAVDVRMTSNIDSAGQRQQHSLRNGYLQSIAPLQTASPSEDIRICVSCVSSHSVAFSSFHDSNRVFARDADREAMLNGRFDHSLRLYVCEGIVRRHGGELCIRLEGSRKDSTGVSASSFVFEVCMRFSRSSTPPGQEPLILPHRETIIADTKRQHDIEENIREPVYVEPALQLPLTRVLCVDDVPMCLKVVNRLLKANGLCVGIPDTATDGAQALAKVKESMQKSAPYELVIIDYEMPVMDGPTAVSLCRGAGYEGLVIGFTGNGVQEDIDYFLGKGADEVMVKPMDIQLLKSILSRGRRVDAASMNQDKFPGSRHNTTRPRSTQIYS